MPLAQRQHLAPGLAQGFSQSGTGTYNYFL
jgi:hypothetical protein